MKLPTFIKIQIKKAEVYGVLGTVHVEIPYELCIYCPI